MILSPVSSDTFFSRYWEQQPLHIARKDSGHFGSLISVSAIEELLSTGELYFPDVQVVNAEQSIASSDYTIERNRINSHRLIQHYKEGATLIVSQAQLKFPALADLCRSVTKSLQMKCQSNVYLSPTGHQGFKSHYDTHDVFILQVSGQKKFRFYPSDIELPFTDDTYNPDLNTATEIINEVDLGPGDTLYIPRGVVHDAVAHGVTDEPSLHITLGVFPIVIRDLLQTMVQVAAEENVDFRRSAMPPGRLQKPQVAELQELFEQLADEDLLTTALARITDDIAVDSNADIRGSLSSPSVTLESKVVINESTILGSERQGDELTLRLVSQVMTFADPLGQAVESLLQGTPLLVASLPGLDAQQQLAVCQHLQQANVIKVVSA